MKSTVLYLATFFIFFVSVHTQAQAEIKDYCKRNVTWKKVKSDLQPYRYTQGKSIKLSFKRYPQRKQIIIPMYREMEHVMIFNTEGVGDHEVKIRVYDAPIRDNTKEMLFEASLEKGQDKFQMPVTYKGIKLYMEIYIPSNDVERSIQEKGCVLFMMGYLDPEMKEDGRNESVMR